jgi:Putative zinc-finger
MRCERAEKLIPLYAGGDLPERESACLRRHLESCADCRSLAAEFEESRDWLRGFAAPHFDEASMDSLRDSVLRDVARIEHRAQSLQWIIPGWNLRFTASLAASLLIAILAAYVYRGWRPRPVHNGADKKDVAITNPSRDQKDSIGGAQRNNGDIKVNPAPVQKRQSIQKGRRGVIENHDLKLVQSPDRVATLTAPPIIAEAAPSGDTLIGPEIPDREMTRIEFQTADPNIRIIWLALKNSNSSSTKPNAKVR